MENTPFRFLDSPASLGLLRQALAQVGLSEETAEQQPADEEAVEPNPYHPTCIRFACPWLSRPVELQWHYYWWPDGMHSELGRVSIGYDGVVRGEVNVEELLRQRFARPLAAVIVEALVASCAELTGKRGQIQQRKRQSGSSADPSFAADRPPE
jgi:hypothetical protein